MLSEFQDKMKIMMIIIVIMNHVITGMEWGVTLP